MNPSTLTLCWEYLTGYAVATDPTSRERPEWPPHPARIFMALAAAWFETGEDSAEGAALRWLESLGDPELQLPPRNSVYDRQVVEVFVPINDAVGDSTAILQSAPTITRPRQPRTFPRVWIGDQQCAAHWTDAEDVKTHFSALDQLCSKVTRIGHSSSLVRMWVADEDADSTWPTESWTPDNVYAEFQVRRVSNGTLDMLASRFNREDRENYAELSGQIAELKTAKSQIKGKGAKNHKAEIEAQISELQQQLELLSPHPPVRPTIGLWTGYRRKPANPVTLQRSCFDTDLLVLTPDQNGNLRLPAEATLAVTKALRGAVMSQCEVDPIPEWVTGHQENGEPLRNDGGHLACLPLPFVGNRHADGHLLGVALAFPESVSRRDRGEVLGKLLVDHLGQPKPFDLHLGRLGVWSLRLRSWTETRQSLMPETWTAVPNGARLWASVTPVVLDRFPKTDRVADRTAWTKEVSETIGQSCERIGLPRPVAVDIDTTSWMQGSPRAFCKRRRLRGPNASRTDARLGDGFSHYPSKGTKAARPQVHAWLEFAEPVVGPILLGAGRYLGYGLFRPWRGRQSS